jgi:lysine-specific demethylase 8
VWKGAADHWPALHRWTFAFLGALDPDRPVQVVHGNRELDTAQLADTTWGAHLALLNRGEQGAGGPVGHLKEFDLLKHFPALGKDVEPGALLPPGSVASHQAWIGPAHARTGLHHDLLDNVAVTLRGKKRFCLLPPGSVEAAGMVSKKFDRWARLSMLGVDDLVRMADQVAVPAPQVVDLDPGDALYIPHGWWHEVVNLEASVLLSGFFGTRRRTWGYWLQTGALQCAHNAGLWRPGHCTCHSSPRAAA